MMRVVVVDPAPATQRALLAVLTSDPELEVVGALTTLEAAADATSTLRPAVIVLDVAVVAKAGLDAFDRFVRAVRLPVVVASPATTKGWRLTFQTLEVGAVDFVHRPGAEAVRRRPDVASAILAKVKAAARAHLQYGAPLTAVSRQRTANHADASDRVIAIGASTGGTEAIRRLLMEMPADAPGFVIAQHMPGRFTRAFAQHCDQRCPVRVREAKDGDRVLRGHALIAPGDAHMRLDRDGDRYRVSVQPGPPVNGHRPSIDALFASTAAVAGSRAVGVILTGMGGDGVEGLAAMRRAGGRTLAQDEATCVVFGMPREAIARGAVDYVLPLPEIGRVALKLSGGAGDGL
jgi:two-component system chemotaxis response regulator CheB